MKSRWIFHYCIIGLLLVVAVSSIGLIFITYPDIGRIEDKKTFESIYVNTNIDFIIPSPSYTQINENYNNYGIGSITPYYESKAKNLGLDYKGDVIIYPDLAKMENTPYCVKRIIDGHPINNGGEAIVDRTFATDNKVDIGDIIPIEIIGKKIDCEVVAISEDNTHNNEGTIGVCLKIEDAEEFAEKKVVFSAAYVNALDYNLCKEYLYNEYKPYGRLKNSSEFENDEIYNEHLNDFNKANWSKEITNCKANYDELNIKYQGVESSTKNNSVLYACIAGAVFFISSIWGLCSKKTYNVLKNYLIKKGGSIKKIKSFFIKGTLFDAIAFCLINILCFCWMLKNTSLNIINNIIYIAIPIGTVIVILLVMYIIIGISVKVKYSIK